MYGSWTLLRTAHNLLHRRRKRGQGGGGRGGQDSPNILPSRLYNIHTCSENRSVYYVRPSQNETASYAYACKRSKKVEKQELVD